MPLTLHHRTTARFPNYAGRLLALVWLLFISSLMTDTALAARDQATQQQQQTELKLAKRKFQAAVKARNREAASAALQGIGQLNSPPAAQYLATLESVPGSLYESLNEALVALSDVEAQRALLAEYKKCNAGRLRNWQRQVLLIDTFARLTSPSGAEALGLAVRDQHAKVRLAAIRALRTSVRPAKEVIPLLIDSLKASQAGGNIGTPHVEAREALAKLTGLDYPHAAAWQEYWQQNAEEFEPLAEDAVAPDIATSDEVSYYGQTVSSRRVLFVIDTSKSMFIVDHEGWPDVPKEEMRVVSSGAASDGVATGTITSGAWKKWMSRNPECVRMTRAKGELARMIADLPAATAFNILSFDSKVDRWQRGLSPASDAAKKSAIKFIAKLQPRGTTAADLALAEAFNLNAAADTIYFLSDGHPTHDGTRLLPIEPILQRVSLANRYRRIIIHTLGFGGGPERFLKPLAEQNSGNYRRIVGPPQIDEERKKPAG